MTQKQITGIILVSLGAGALVFLYKAFYKPNKEIDELFNKAKSTTK